MDTISTYGAVPFISGLFNVLIDRLTPERLRESLLGLDSTVTELSKLRTTMMIVRRVINDAEEKQETDPDIKNWLNEVKHTVYDAENLIDEIHSEAMRTKLEVQTNNETQSCRPTMLLRSITATFDKLATALDPFHQGIDCRIQKMNHRFEGFSQLIDVLHLKFSLEQHRKTPMMSRVLSTSLVDESMIYGRDSETKLFLDILEDGVPGHDKQDKKLKGNDICILAIVGMPGIGKTTLTQLVFNDARAENLFQFKSWIHVPQEFDNVEVIRLILSVLPEPSSDSFIMPSFQFPNDLESHLVTLRKRVNGLRILIVLDDVWDEKLYFKWKPLLLALKAAAPGSAIIVTTRNENIAYRLHPMYVHHMRVLSDEDCWTLFKAYAFGHVFATPDAKLETIGKRVVANCRGLPLAIRAIAGHLSYAEDAKEWEIIASNKLWELPEQGKNEILPALLLSYNYLPPHLKRCFAYCSIFPKNYQFEKEKLVLLWMAEGYIEQPKNDGTSMEYIGETYFHDLLARSFFQGSSTSTKQHFVMHDLIHELAAYIMGELSFMLESNISHVKGSPYHFSFMQSKYDRLETFGLTKCADRLRTFLPVFTTSPNQCCYYLSHNSLQSLQLFKCLRVLSLRGYRITKVPASIGNLKHLRFLDFASTFIKELPEPICELLNLQTLLLSHCERITGLPTNLSNLVHLRHLDIRGTKKLEAMPEHLGKLSCLQTLTDFVVGEDCGESIRELGGLFQLKGSLRILGLENVVAQVDAFAAKLREKAHLDELALMQLESCFDDNRHHEKVLLSLKPHANLRRLFIHYYEGDRFPSWFGDETLNNLEEVHLENCPNCNALPSLGRLPLLKHLTIKDFNQLRTLGMEFYGHQSKSSSPFKSLVTLKFEGFPQWKKWSAYDGDGDPFPCLQELRVWDCKELIGDFPLNLPSLVVLDVKKCEKLSGSLPHSPLRQLSLEDFEGLNLSSLYQLTCLGNLSLIWAKQVKGDSISIANAREALQHLTSLERLSISTDPQIKFRRPWHLPSSIKSLTVSGYPEETETIINGCTQLQYLHAAYLGSPLHLPAGHYQQLNFLGMVKCDSVTEFQIIPEDDDDKGFTSLYDLYVKDCTQLTSLPVGGLLATNLTTLVFHGSKILTGLPNGLAANLPSLRFLSMQYCPEFESFPEDDFPNLQTITIGVCDKFAVFPEAMSRWTSLEMLDIQNCGAFESFPTNGLPLNLKILNLLTCKSIISLPERICHNLKRLTIWKCPKIESLPQVGLPLNLESLFVFGCEKLINKYADWNLVKLISLKELRIGGHGDDIESFPADNSLPTTLNILKIEHFLKLRSINCRELQRIPTLFEFEIERCPALQHFSDQNLPPSLWRLTIERSSLIAKRCLEPDGQYADKVSHITCLELNYNG